MAANPHYTASAPTTQKTQLPAVLLVLGDVFIHADRTGNTVPLFRFQFLRVELFTVP
jgi:hypothetical protein